MDNEWKIQLTSAVYLQKFSFKCYQNQHSHFLDTRYHMFPMVFKYFKQKKRVCSDIQWLTVITINYMHNAFYLAKSNFTKIFDKTLKKSRLMCDCIFKS